MKRNFLFFLLTTAFIICSVGIGWAMPILNDGGSDGFEDVGGVPFAQYVNSGELMFTSSGNNEGSTFNSGILELMIENWGGYDPTTFTLVSTSVNWTSVDGDSGTYMVNGSGLNTIEFYAVKAGNGFAVYIEDPAESYGSWSTYDCWV